MRGGEYLDAERLVGLWRSLQEAIDAERVESGLADRRFPGRARQPLAARRTGAFQPRREPQGRRAPFRLSGDLRRLARRSWRASARAPRRGAARIRRRRGEERTLAAARACPSRERKLRLVEGDRRDGRNLPPAALDGARGDAAARRRRDGGAGGSRGANAGCVALGPAEPSVRRGDGRIQCAFPRRRLVAARLSGRGEPRRRAADARGDRAAGRFDRRAGDAPRQVGRVGAGPFEGDARPIRRDRAPRPQGGAVLRQGDAPAGWGRHRRGRGRAELGRRLGARQRGPMARRDARRLPQARDPRRRPSGRRL